MNVYTYEVASRKLSPVAKNQGIGYLTDLGREGGRAVLYRMRSRSDSNLFLIDRRSGKEVLLTNHQGPGRFEGGLLSPDATIVYLSSDKDRDFSAFARVRLHAGGTPSPIEILAERTNAELEDFKLTEDGRTAALLWNVAGRSELSFLDINSGTERKGHCFLRRS